MKPLAYVHATSSYRTDTQFILCVELSECAACAGADGSSVLPWKTFSYYKETPWSFILWRGTLWMLFPKRAFESRDGVSRCPSPWWNRQFTSSITPARAFRDLDP